MLTLLSPSLKFGLLLGLIAPFVPCILNQGLLFISRTNFRYAAKNNTWWEIAHIIRHTREIISSEFERKFPTQKGGNRAETRTDDVDGDVPRNKPSKADTSSTDHILTPSVPTTGYHPDLSREFDPDEFETMDSLCVGDSRMDMCLCGGRPN